MYNVNKSIEEAARRVLEGKAASPLYESILLVEDRIDFLKEKNPEIDTSHDTAAQHKDAGNIIDHFAEHGDPSPNKKFTPWIVNQYKQKNIRQEDHPRVKETLSNFSKYQAKLPNKDINQYSSLNDIDTAVSPHIGTAASKKEEIRQIKDDGADLIHSENGLTVHRLKTKEAAQQYGKGTKWCTAADQNNMFDHYNKNGPLYVIQKDGAKHQFHFPSEQFMDEKDDRIPSLSKFVDANPELKNVKEFKGEHPMFGSLEEQIAHLKSGSATPKYVTQMYDAKPKNIPGELTHQVANSMISAFNPKEPYSINSALNAISKHESTLPSTMHDIVNHTISRKGSFSSDILSSKNISPETMHLVISHPKLYNANALLTSPSLKGDHIQRIYDETAIDHDFKHETIANHPAAPVNILTTLASGRNHLARVNALKNPSMPADVLSQHVDDPRLHAALSKNTAVSPDALRNIFKKNQTQEWIHENLAGNKSTPKDVLESLTEHPDASIAKKAAKTLKSSKGK